MASEVIKRDGTRKPFDPGKIRKSIEAACAVANLPEERKNAIVEKITNSTIQMAATKEVIPTSEIREYVLGQLDLAEPAASAAWRKHDQEKKGG